MKMVKCPNCGSGRVEINGVEQQKKSAMYYLSGAYFVEVGMRHSEMLKRALSGKKENARCLECGHAWRVGKASPEPEPSPMPSPKTDRFCRRCGEKAEEGDLYCIQCGARLK